MGEIVSRSAMRFILLTMLVAAGFDLGNSQAAVNCTSSVTDGSVAALHNNQYVLTSGGLSCAAISCDFSFTIPYNTSNGTASSSTFKPPCPATDAVLVSGVCGYDHLSFIMEFTANRLSLDFDINRRDDHFSVNTVQLIYVLDPTLFPGAAQPGRNVSYSSPHLDLFNTSVGMFYQCKAHSTFDLGSGYVMETAQFDFQAFTNGTDKESSANICTADSSTPRNEMVPIVVGVALAVMTVIVLVAFAIAQRAVRRRYHSV